MSLHSHVMLLPTIRHLRKALLGSVLISMAASPTLFATLSPALAQEAEKTLQTIVIGGEDNSLETQENASRGLVPLTSSAAGKSNKALIRTPQAVNVITATQLEKQDAESITAAIGYTPGILGTISDPRADWIRIRGFSGVEYLDGLKFARGAYAWPKMDPYMLDRLEILKGPAAALYGQIPPGGLMNLVSKRPTGKNGGELRLQYGSNNRKQIMADIQGTVPQNDSIAYRIAGAFRKADTEIDFTNDDHMVGSAAISYTPSDQTKLTLLATAAADDAGSAQFLPSQGTALPNPNGKIPRSTFLGEPGFDDFRSQQYSLGYLFDHSFDNGVKISSKLRWSSVDYDLQTVRGFGMMPNSNTLVTRRAVKIDDLTEAFGTDNSLRYDLDTGAINHKLLAGIDYLHQKSNLSLAVSPMAPIDAYNPVYGNPVSPFFFTLLSNKQTLKQAGLYAQDQISWNNWELMLTARNDWYETKTFDKLKKTHQKTSGNHQTYRAGLLYAFDNGLSPYISYATSFEPVVGVNTRTREAFKPTEGKQIEVGVKYAPSFINGLFTLTAFNLQQENTIVSDGIHRVQIGESEVKGIELEGQVDLENGLTLKASYAYLDSQIKQGTNKGKKLPYVANHQASIWANYAFSGALDGLDVNAGIRYTGEVFGTTSNTIATGKDAIVDAGMSYDFGAKSKALEGASLQLNVTNLFDKDYVSLCTGTTECYWGEGRNIRGSLVYKW
ncbi:MAG: TonB-dependent siderophore receptor [Cohaesibacter sp.]|nr:TonB-dependent siderophore receptor [Cohaesibacter sp.]